MIQELGKGRGVARNGVRRACMARANWDFFTAATGTKPGFIENISESGCLFRTVDAIEPRRWIRLLIQQPGQDIWLSAIGRIIRRENKMQMWDEDTITLYRYGVEFVRPVNLAALSRVREKSDPALGNACHNLLTQDLEGA